MNKQQAITTIKNKPISPWMAYAITPWNKGFIIADTAYIKRNPNTNYEFIRKGDMFPLNSAFTFKR